MKRSKSEILSTAVRIKCTKCGYEAVGCAGHVSKPHANCQGRAKGEPKDKCGKWISR